MIRQTLAAALALGLVAAGTAHAMPAAGTGGLTAGPAEAVIQVYDGCGPYGHRGPYGGCRPGGQAGGYRYGRACPPGYHMGPYARRCWPN